MLRVQVRLEERIFGTVEAAACHVGGDPGRLARAPREVVRTEPAFGVEAPRIARDIGGLVRAGDADRPEFLARSGTAA
jgi:hypothetical protein